MFGKKVGIDLGTFSILIYIKGRGIVLQEPSVVAISLKDDRIVAIGQETQLPEARQTIEADGLLVLPGVIDPHVHLGYGRYPEDFDGIVVNAPWVDQTGFTLGAIWNHRALSEAPVTAAKMSLVADRVMAINDGKLLTIGTPDEVRNNAAVQQAYLGTAA